MSNITSISRAKYSIGELVHHRLFDYRGVIVDVDQVFDATEQWYETMAKSRPPKNKPWYHVLVDGSVHATYVAEQNLEHDDSQEPVSHPMLDLFFERFDQGRYVRLEPDN